MKTFAVLAESIVFLSFGWQWVVRIEWKLEDLWIGAFWKKSEYAYDLWVCLLPCLPIHILASREATR